MKVTLCVMDLQGYDLGETFLCMEQKFIMELQIFNPKIDGSINNRAKSRNLFLVLPIPIPRNKVLH